jgi:hypothetical protein
MHRIGLLDDEESTKSQSVTWTPNPCRPLWLRLYVLCAA